MYKGNCFRQLKIKIPRWKCAIGNKYGDEDNLLSNTPEIWRKNGKCPAFLRNNNRVLYANNGKPVQNLFSSAVWP
jgi:hypothetical protein